MSKSDVRRASLEAKKNGSDKPRRISGEPSVIAITAAEGEPSVIAITAAEGAPTGTTSEKVPENTPSSSSLPTASQRGLVTSSSRGIATQNTNTYAPPLRATRIPSKANLEHSTPGWAHPSQKLPNPYLDMPVKKEKKDPIETSSSRIERIPPTTDKQQSIKQTETPSNSVDKLKDTNDKPSEILKETPSGRMTTTTLSDDKNKKPKKPTDGEQLEHSTPGWAHPSQKLPNPYLDMPAKKEKKDPIETSSSRIERIPPTTDKQQSIKQTEASLTTFEKLKDTNDKPSENLKESSSGRLTTTTLSDDKNKKTKKPVDGEPSRGRPTVEKVVSNSKLPLEKEPSKGTLSQEGSKKQISIDAKFKKDGKVSINEISDPAVNEPKKKYFTMEKKRRHSRKVSRKFDKMPDKTEGAGDIADLSVAHPDFLDESFLEAVDNEPRRESRISDEYYGGMKPLRFNTHKKKNMAAFKERVHKKRRGRGGGVGGAYDWEVNKRLPDDVVPFQYTVYLEPHIESNIFFGRVSIALDLVLPKSQLWLHARNLHITSTQLFDQNDIQIPILGAHKFRKNEFFVIFLEANLRPGIYMINIDYNGILTDKNQVGMFIRNYATRDGSRRHLVYTQLSPLYARRVFPCFDEPSFKATYEISVVRPSNDFIAISNMIAENEEEESPQRGSTTVFYYITPPISTYHLTLVICDFHHIPINDSRINVPFTLYLRDERVDNYKMAVEIVLDAIDWCQENFKIKFPLPKLDLIIMPELTLPSIEGYSVIMIQEDLLKAKEEYEYETLHYTLIHEVISQWIGGSVTVMWWNDLWYKEGLTTMLTNLFLDKKYPEQQAIPNFICYSLQPCMFYDTFITARKIDRIIDPNAIGDCMDPVAFTKGAAIFRMLEQMEPTAFMEGLQNFLTIYHLQNASWKNLSECLNAAYDKNPHNLLNVDNMMFSWSQYPGYPLIASAIGVKAIAVNQRRFITSLDSQTHDVANFPTWEFPVSYVLSHDPNSVRMMSMKADSIDTDARSSIPEGIQWYKVNNRQTGFFRVVYQDDEWNTIKKVLLTRPELFTPEDRANFLDDMFSLSRAGFTCYGHTLSTLTYLRYGRETAWLPWACILKHFVFLKNALSSNEEDSKNFQKYMAYIINPVLNEEVWTLSDTDDPKKRKWKLAVLRLACTMEIPSAKARLEHLVKAWGFNGKKPKPEALRFLIMRYGAPENGYTDHQWMSLWNMYQDEKKMLEKKKLLAVMASVGNDSQQTSMLYSIKSDEVAVDDHGFFTVLYEMATTRKGSHRVWEFIRTNWAYLAERFSPTDSRLFLLFPHVAQLFDQDSQIDELTEFITFEIPTIAPALSYASNNIYWNERYPYILHGLDATIAVISGEPGFFKSERYPHSDIIWIWNIFSWSHEVLSDLYNEINSIATLLNVNLKWIQKATDDPFWLVELQSEEEVVKLTSRSVTLRYAIELWSSSSLRDEFHNHLKTLPSSFTAPYFDENVSYKVKVEVFGSSQTHAQKVERIENQKKLVEVDVQGWQIKYIITEGCQVKCRILSVGSFSYLPLKGPVKLQNPDVSFQYIEYYSHDHRNIPEEPTHFYFGRIVSEGQRDLISKLSLKTRKFIGNTSMDPQLSLIMANQGLVRNGTLVYDPFVGSGSLLIGAAQFGGLVMGADLDYLMLHGKSRPTRKQARHKPRQEENILANMKQYGLAHRYIDVVVADCSLPLWHDSFKLDAIITDPPYGVREAVERVGTVREVKTISDHHLSTHFPSKIQYGMAQLLHDLLSFAAKHLLMGARLVTWVPIIRLEYDESQLPHHECLRLIANSEQILSTNASRRLLTYEKIGEPQDKTRTIVEEEESFRQKYSRYIDENRKLKSEDEHKEKKFKNAIE